MNIVLGAEFDHELRGAVHALLLSAGFEKVEQSYGMAGSQEVATERWTTRSVEVTLEIETYIGTSVLGPADWVCRIQDAIDSWERSGRRGSPIWLPYTE